jgi:hypothetical protein
MRMETSPQTTSPVLRPAMTDNPWFWVYLFGTASLIGICLLGPKINDRQLQHDVNFTRRSELLQQRANPEKSVNVEQLAPEVEPRYILLSPLYISLAVGTALAWAIFWWQHFYSGKNASIPRQTENNHA